MREFLFRAKSTAHSGWMYGMLEFLKGDVFIVDSINDVRRSSPVERGSVCQYAGIKDKNSTKIFEGDIVKENEGLSTGIVEFYEGSFITRNEHNRRMIPALYMGENIRGMNLNFYEVIGNIYDNPELIPEQIKL